MKKSLLFILSLFIAISAFAQTAADVAKWQKLAEQGDAAAQYNLGICYTFGEGIKDMSKAVYWYSKAAEQGLAQAQNNLGGCYYTGEGVVKDYAKAVYWYSKAAEQGFAQAQDILGDCYYNGEGVAEDKSKAVYWYSKAAEQGLVQAQFNLGRCYYIGEGVAEDKSKAAYWYRKAARQGHSRAQFILELGVLEEYAEYTREDFPDPVFCKYVFRNFDTNQDGILSKAEADAVKMIDVQKSGIKSLDGIQYFTNLRYLRCDYNQLTTLDVSKNSALTHLFCDYNQLTTLNVSENTKLMQLTCTSNQLTSLDLSNNTALENLFCFYNQIEVLNLSKTNLENGSYNKKSRSPHPLYCAPMPTLKTVYLKNGWNIRGINKKRRRFYIPQQTKIIFVD